MTSVAAEARRGADPTRNGWWREALAPVARALLGLFGWRVEGTLPTAEKFVLVAAPHTSNWDGLILVLCGFALAMPLVWLGKRELFKGPAGWALRRLGGIALDRAAPAEAVREATRALAARDRVALAIPPEGTRKRAPQWKMGFYVIARHARVPIVLGFVDYRRRVAGIGPRVDPTGNVAEDMASIRAFYETVTARYPDQVGPVAHAGSDG
ncbi:MAG TPA: 1-acyl-sn-glycerol-3-phosphate acyltransferase [Chloroflexota bacterium]|nr:1-acyl-sn-glycerol-3-phosphate acyltransferase [Chloroflexota bacterium]